MKLFNSLLYLLFFIIPSVSFSNEGFEKNNGQVFHPDGSVNEDVLFIFNDQGIKITLRTNGFSYETTTVNDSSWKDQIHNFDHNLKFQVFQERIDFIFPQQPEGIKANNPIESTKNYMTPAGVIQSMSYKSVIYEEIAEGIDIIFKIGVEGFKYDIVKHENIDLNTFYLTVGSSADIEWDHDHVNFNLSESAITEKIPLSYVAINNRPIDITYKVIGDKIYFHSEENVYHEKVIIDPDPDMVWSTFWGGDQYDLITDAAITAKDTLYTVGITMSTNNIATSGAYQTVYQGDLDIFISKFSNNGDLVWSTYYNGPQTERVYAISIDDNESIFVAGCTFSTVGIISGGAQQTTVNGVDDIFILKMTPQGTREWCTYHGGNGHDFVTDMDVKNDTIYMVGHTTSSDVMASPGSFIENYTANEAGHLTLFSGSGSFLYGTYLGSENNNSAEGLAVNENRIYITGRTSGETDIATPGAHQETLAGFTNAFLSSFDKSGELVWGTYFGGQYTDVANDITLDSLGGVYIVGNASSDNNIGIPGAYQETRLSSEQGFIAHFDEDGNRLWSTYTGGTGSDYISVVDSKQDGKIYVGGYTTSSEIIASPGAYQPSPAGNYDVFIQEFDFNGNYNWGTFLGGVGRDELLSLTLTSSNNLIAGGSTDQNDTIFGIGNSHSDQYNGGTIDGFLAYLCQNVTPSIYYNNDSLYASPGDSYEWFLNGQPLNLFTSSILPLVDGEYTVEISSFGKCPVLSAPYDHSTVNTNEYFVSQFSVYPNPFTDQIKITTTGEKQIRLFDVTGRIVYEDKCNEACFIDLSYLNNGFYQVVLNDEKVVLSKSILKL